MIKKIITLSILSLSFTFASVTPHTNYSIMSTAQLEIEVETLSNIGELPFEMGLELIKRWSQL